MVYNPSVAATSLTDTREAILDATDRLMQRYGFRKMTMDDIAREAGISKRTIYTYFPSKEEVGLSSIARVVSFAQSQMQEAAARDGAFAERLREMLTVRVMARVASVREYRDSLDGLFEIVRPAYMERRQASFEKEAAMVASLVREGVDAGEFVSRDPEADATAMLRATNAFLPYSLSVAELGDTKKIGEGLAALVDLLIRGLQR
jgi:AcrR family transcriptional regulator